INAFRNENRNNKAQSMNTPLYAVYGASGCGRGIMPLAKAQLGELGIRTERLVFIDDNPAARLINGHRVLTYDEFLTTEADTRYAIIAIANGNVREALARRCAADGVQSWSVRAANVITM